MPNASRSVGTMSWASTRAYAADAEYHWLRSPGASSATRCGGSRSAAIIAALKRVKDDSASYSGPSLASSIRSGVPGSTPAGLQTRIATLAPSPRPRIVASSKRPGTPSSESHAGGS
jgi:hypothetical protein